MLIASRLVTVDLTFVNCKSKSDLSLSRRFFLVRFLLTHQHIIIASVLVFLELQKAYFEGLFL